MEPKWAVDAAFYYKYIEEGFLAQFLMTLEDLFETVHIFILYRSPLPFIDDVLFELINEKIRRMTLTKPGDLLIIAIRDISKVHCKKYDHMTSNCFNGSTTHLQCTYRKGSGHTVNICLSHPLIVCTIRR